MSRVKLNPVLKGRCPVCHFEEFHLVSCQLGQSEADNARLQVRVEELEIKVGVLRDCLNSQDVARYDFERLYRKGRRDLVRAEALAERRKKESEGDMNLEDELTTAIGERNDARQETVEARGQLDVEIAKRVEAIDRWDTSFREMEGLAGRILTERNEAREERDDARREGSEERERFQHLLNEYSARMVEVREQRRDLIIRRQDTQDELSRVKVDLMDAQQTIDAMRAEGCPARGLVENIFNGLTSHGQPTSPLLAEMAEAAAKLLVDVPVCEHKDELKRLKEVVYNYFDFTPSCDENNKCFACGEQWYPNECTSTCLATMLFTAIKEGKDTSIVWLELSDELDDARAILDKVRALCDDYSKPMGRRHVLALLPPRAVIQAEAEEAAKRKEVPPDGE